MAVLLTSETGSIPGTEVSSLLLLWRGEGLTPGWACSPSGTRLDLTPCGLLGRGQGPEDPDQRLQVDLGGLQFRLPLGQSLLWSEPGGGGRDRSPQERPALLFLEPRVEATTSGLGPGFPWLAGCTLWLLSCPLLPSLGRRAVAALAALDRVGRRVPHRPTASPPALSCPLLSGLPVARTVFSHLFI